MRIGCTSRGGSCILHHGRAILVCDTCLVEYHQTDFYRSTSLMVALSVATYEMMIRASPHNSLQASKVEAAAKAVHAIEFDAYDVFLAWLQNTPKETQS